MRHVTTCTLMVIGCFFAGCERGAETEPVLTPAARTSPAAERAVGSLAAARCDREQRCDNIGEGARYMNREHCMKSMMADGYEELDECGLGVNQDHLAQCLAEIRSEDCAGAIDRLETLAACRANHLCVE